MSIIRSSKTKPKIVKLRVWISNMLICSCIFYLLVNPLTVFGRLPETLHLPDLVHIWYYMEFGFQNDYAIESKGGKPKRVCLNHQQKSSKCEGQKMAGNLPLLYCWCSFWLEMLSAMRVALQASDSSYQGILAQSSQEHSIPFSPCSFRFDNLNSGWVIYRMERVRQEILIFLWSFKSKKSSSEKIKKNLQQQKSKSSRIVGKKYIWYSIAESFYSKTSLYWPPEKLEITVKTPYNGQFISINSL